MRTPLPTSAKPFARLASRQISVKRLEKIHTDLSARLDTEPHPAKRFSLTFQQKVMEAAKLSQAHPIAQGFRLVLGVGADGLLDKQRRLISGPKLREVGIVGYLGVLPLATLHVAYAGMLKKIFGEELYEPRMIQIVDRLVYWTTASACEISALVGLTLRYAAMAVCVAAALPIAVGCALYAAFEEGENYEALSFHGPADALAHRLQRLLEAIDAPDGPPNKDEGVLYRVGFFEAVAQGIVSVETDMAADANGSAGAQITRLGEADRPDPIVVKRSDSQETRGELNASVQTRLQTWCKKDAAWTERVMRVAQLQTFEVLTQALSGRGELTAHGVSRVLSLSDSRLEMLLSHQSENVIRLACEMRLSAPHQVYTRFKADERRLSYTDTDLATSILIGRPGTDAPALAVEAATFASSYATDNEGSLS